MITTDEVIDMVRLLLLTSVNMLGGSTERVVVFTGHQPEPTRKINWSKCRLSDMFTMEQDGSGAWVTTGFTEDWQGRNIASVRLDPRTGDRGPYLCIRIMEGQP
jgi:hypothetical protein